jgi:hypothetical protein
MLAVGTTPHPLTALHPLPAPMAVLIGLAAFAVVALQGMWELAQHFNTIAHESADAVVGFGEGSKITKVELNPDGTGGTHMPAGVKDQCRRGDDHPGSPHTSGCRIRGSS